MSPHSAAPSRDLLPYAQIVIRFLAALSPGAVVWRTASGPVNAGQLRVGLLANDPAYLSWMSNSLRTIRDVIATQAEDGLLSASPSQAHHGLARQASEQLFLSLLDEVPVTSAPVFWTPDSGLVPAEALRAAMLARAPVAIEYMAHVICLHEEALSG